MDRIRAHVVISGFVQGVFFRYNTTLKAQQLRLFGWVRNNFNGTVEAIFEGAKKDVESMVAWCRVGPHGARVEYVDVNWCDYTGEFSSFNIKY